MHSFPCHSLLFSSIYHTITVVDSTVLLVVSLIPRRKPRYRMNNDREKLWRPTGSLMQHMFLSQTVTSAMKSEEDPR